MEQKLENFVKFDDSRYQQNEFYSFLTLQDRSISTNIDKYLIESERIECDKMSLNSSYSTNN